MYYQQGDVILRRQSEAPARLQVIETDLLFKGQNHHHRVRGGFKIAKDGEATWLLSDGCEVYHEEHKPVELPKGTYRLDFVQEYDHFEEESRQVID